MHSKSWRFWLYGGAITLTVLMLILNFSVSVYFQTIGAEDYCSSQGLRAQGEGRPWSGPELNECMTEYRERHPIFPW